MKNAPKSMISEMMKSSIPRNWASTRELWLAGRRAVVLVVVVRVADGYGRGLHQLLTTWCTGLPVDVCTRPTRSARSQPERVSGKVEITISSMP